MTNPAYRFPVGLLKVPLLKPPYGLVDLEGGVVYVSLANFRYDVFGIYNRKGEFQRFFDARTSKHVSINMERMHEGWTPLTELDGPEIAYLENRFGPTFGKVPLLFQLGVDTPKYYIPPNLVAVWNKRKHEYEQVPSHILYKTFANKRDEVFGIYDRGHFRRFYNIHTFKPAAINMELDEINERNPYARDLQGDEIQFLLEKFGRD